MAAKTNGPDAWLRLVLASMSVADLQRELASGTLSADETRWMRAELAKRGAK